MGENSKTSKNSVPQDCVQHTEKGFRGVCGPRRCASVKELDRFHAAGAPTKGREACEPPVWPGPCLFLQGSMTQKGSKKGEKMTCSQRVQKGPKHPQKGPKTGFWVNLGPPDPF